MQSGLAPCCRPFRPKKRLKRSAEEEMDFHTEAFVAYMEKRRGMPNMDDKKDTCKRCGGTGIVAITIESLLFEDRRICLRCVEGKRRWSRLKEIIRQFEPASDEPEDPDEDLDEEQQRSRILAPV